MSENDGTFEVWERAYQVGAALVLFAVPFVHSPPSHSLGESIWDWQKLAVFLVALLVLVGGGVLARKRRALCLGCVIFALIVLVAYFYFYHKFSCPLEQGRLVIGWTYTNAAGALLETDANQTCVDLLRSFASDPFRVYAEDGIYLNEITLAILYVGMLTLFSAAVLCWVLRSSKEGASSAGVTR